MIDMVKLYPFGRQDQSDGDNIFLVEYVVHFPVFLAFHPHASSTLIQSHMHSPVVKNRHLVFQNLLVDPHIALPQLDNVGICFLGFLDSEFFVVVFQVFKSTNECLLGQI